MNEKRQQILNWQSKGLIDNVNIEKALIVSAANNSPKQWLEFISSSMLWLSILSIAFGTIFFFAYNWNEISIFQKFALIQGLIIASTFIYTQTQSQSLANTAVLFFLALLIGSLFALFGQIYQTGKDPWQLFILWALFITPLAFASKSSSLWLLWLGISNLTLALILDVRYGLLGIMFNNELNMLLYAFLNLLAATSFEYFYYSKFKLILNRIASQVAIIIAMIAFSWVAIYSIFEAYTLSNKGFDMILYFIWMISIYYFYRVKTIDVLILSSWMVSTISYILALFGRLIGNNYNGGTSLLFGILIIGLTTIGIKWLIKLLEEIKHNGEVL